MKGKTFQIYGVQIPRKCIESRHIYSYSSPPIHNPLPTKREITYSPKAVFFRESVSHTSRKGVGGQERKLRFVLSKFN